MMDHSCYFKTDWRSLSRIDALLFGCVILSMAITMLLPWTAFALSAAVTVNQTTSTVTINASADLQSFELSCKPTNRVAVGRWAATFMQGIRYCECLSFYRAISNHRCCEQQDFCWERYNQTCWMGRWYLLRN